MTRPFTSPGTHNRSDGGALSGIGNARDRYAVRTYHAYYQWVPLVLFLQVGT